ncbi:MAG: hypothetical protein ACLGPL_11625, partial [Acidobacteriota bacterium]
MSRSRLILVLCVCSVLTLSGSAAMKASAQDGTPNRLESKTCVIPRFENVAETEHFILHWTNTSKNEGDNIPDPGVVRETGEYLETAWKKYETAFGRRPYMARGANKIDVYFRDLECFGEADPPDVPISFDAENWMKKPGIRKPTSAHELFHKLQYAFGYRTRW